MSLFRRRSSDHIDPGELTAYRQALEANMARIETTCRDVGDIADDLRHRTRDPEEVAEQLVAAEMELEEIAQVVGNQEPPEPLRALHAEFDANLERALRGVVTIERGCGLTRLAYHSMYDDGPLAYWKRGHLNIIHAMVRMREISEVLLRWRTGAPAEASVAARIHQLGA